MAKRKTESTTSKAAKKANLNKFKMEAANEVGVNLDEGGNLTAKEAGSVGGQMVKKMVDNYKKGNK